MITTAYGDIVIELYPYDAPITVHNFADWPTLAS